MSKKRYKIELNITCMSWDSAEAYVEAESEEEARKLFESNPSDYDWGNRKTQDSEIRDWEIESVEDIDFDFCSVWYNE